MVVNNVIEVFMFVNPLGSECYETGKMIVNFSNERNEKVRLRFVPLLNFQTIGQHLRDQNITGASIDMRNRLYEEFYHASLAFQAASMQGKKKGRQFLLALQKAIVIDKQAFSKEAVVEAAKDAKLDMEMFEEDLLSDLVKNAFTKDQKLAQEMSVNQAPSCVIFQHSSQELGYRIESTITKQLLHGLCDEKADDTPKHEGTLSNVTLQMV